MKNIKTPKEIIAEALDCDIDSIHEEAAISKHPSWDSLGQLSVIVELETNYNITINNEDVLKYSDFKSINQLYKSLLKNE